MVPGRMGHTGQAFQLEARGCPRTYLTFPPACRWLGLVSSSSQTFAAMSGGRDWDLWRTRLCRLGPSHCAAQCPHAHSLSELRAPREVGVRYADVWDQQQVHRFYRQQLSDEQIAVFRDYWEHATQRFDRPSWAVALFLLLET